MLRARHLLVLAVLLARAASLAAQTAPRPVEFTGKPRSFQVVRIPVPAEVCNTDSIRIEIVPTGSFSVLSAQRVTVSRSASTRDLLVTIGISADALAGRQTAAHARFTGDATEVIVPVEANVTAVYDVAVSMDAIPQLVRVGDRVELHARLTNRGNAPDTVHLSLLPPEPWQYGAREAVIVVAPRSTSVSSHRLVVPRNSATGSFFIHTRATSKVDTTAVLTTLNVGNAVSELNPPGPTARIGFGTVGVQDGRATTIGQLALAGPLTSGIHVDGRISTQRYADAASVRGLARLGTYATTPQLAAWSNTWRLVAGSTYADFGDVFGTNAGGRGVSFNFDNHDISYEVVAARPETDVDGDHGSILGAHFARRIGLVKLGGAATRMETPGSYARQLEAYGVDVAAQLSEVTSLNGNFAYRDYGIGTGLGYSAGLAHSGVRSRGQLRFTHAPGGSTAFARAEDEFTATLSHTFTDRYLASAALVRASDDNAANSSTNTTAISLLQQLRVNKRVVARLDVRKSDFELNGSPFSFSNTADQLSAGATARIGALSYSSDLAVQRVRRGVRTSDIDAKEAGNHLAWRNTLWRALANGSLQLDASYERSDPGIGFVPEQTIVNMRADRVQLPGAPRNFSIDAEIGYHRWTGIRSQTSYRAGINYLLPFRTEIAAMVERNPLLYSAAGSAPIIFALRLERSVTLPRLAGKAAGIVFQDYDGDGRRDVNEPGVANIAVRREGAHAVTAGDGSYRFLQQGRGRVEVDQATLPHGWVVNHKSGDRDIAITPTSTVEVHLQLGAAERLRHVDLSKVVVGARDDRGRLWVARRTTDDGAVFDALPVGAYEIELDATASVEPLRIDGPTPRVQVTREASTRVSVPVSGRPLRFKNGEQTRQ